MIIAIDFDGTCVTHAYPYTGTEIGATKVLKKLTDNGHQLILYTMRSNKELDDAIEWFKDRDIPLWGINENPEQSTWTSSPKPFAHLYIDDSALGVPLCQNLTYRPYVDWDKVTTILQSWSLL
jgi:hypothetical protein